MYVRNLSRGVDIAHDLEIARTFVARMRGLLGRDGLAPGSALWIQPCTSIHTFGMRFSIDAAFLNAQGRVIRLYRSLRPCRLTRVVWAAVGVLELADGTLARTGTCVGDQLDLGTIARDGLSRGGTLWRREPRAGGFGPALPVSSRGGAVAAVSEPVTEPAACREVLKFLPFSLDRSRRVPVYPSHFEPARHWAW